ncbi:MAG: 2TM domain-containing protein [Acidimicrobiia bacterium]
MSTASNNPPTASGNADDQRLQDAREYVHNLRAFYIHATVFAVSMVIIFIVNVAVNVAAGITDEWWAWWSVWVLLGWGLGVAIHGLVVRLSRPNNRSSAWEERQIDKILSSDDTEHRS